MPRARRHHNNQGARQVRRGRTRDQVEKIEQRIPGAEGRVVRAMLDTAEPILSPFHSGRYAYLMRPGQSILLEGIPTLAVKLDDVIDAARRVLHLEARLGAGDGVDRAQLDGALEILRRAVEQP